MSLSDGLLISGFAAVAVYVIWTTAKEFNKPVDKMDNRFIEELEGPFRTVDALNSAVKSYREFDGHTVVLDNVIVLNRHGDSYLIYETIGKNIYRK